MTALFASLAIFFGWITLLVLWRRWIARRPAQELPQGGHLLVHSPPEKVIAWSFLGTVTVLIPVGIYYVWLASGVGGELYIISLGGLCGWVSLLYLRSVYNRIELTSTGIRQRRLSVDVLIPWPEVSRITEAPLPTAVLIHGRNGKTVRLDKVMVGLPIVFTYFRQFLSSELNSSALSYLLPQTALQLRIAAGRKGTADGQANEDI